MASAPSEGVFPLTRSWSFEILPPDLSDLRVIILGNSWTHRCLVENLLLNKNETRPELQPFTRVSGPLQDKKITVINTQDLLCPYLTDQQLTGLIQGMAAASMPGPHVFLLVLQPEDFTQHQHERLQMVLEKFSDQSFNHSMLIIAEEEEATSAVYINNIHLKKMIKKCRYRYMWLKDFDENETQLKNFKLAELFSRLGQIVKENHSSHLIHEKYEDTASVSESDDSILANVQKAGLTGGDPNKQELGAEFPDYPLRIVLFGKSDDKKKTLGKFIIGEKDDSYSHTLSKMEQEEWRGRRPTVIKTSNLLSMSVEKIMLEINRFMLECHPGPNVLLLLVKPSDFTKEDRQAFSFILSLLGPNAFNHCILIFTHDEQMTPDANKLLIHCGMRYYHMPSKNHSDLMKTIRTMVHTNNDSFVTFADEIPVEMPLNLVLCGRKEVGKISAADAILGETQSTESSSSKCIKRQKQRYERWLSIVEMPSLSDKPPQAALELCFNSVSLCDPDGVHAFVLVLPVAPLADEDKAEFRIFRDSLGPCIDAFTVILFTVESDPSAEAYTDFVRQNKDLLELCQSCGEKSIIFNIKDQIQVSAVLNKLESLTKLRNMPQSYTKRMFVQAQIEKLTTLHSNLPVTETRLLSGASPHADLRIVLIGKTGSGKSSSGNTILRRQQFECDFSQTSVTKLCQKAQGVVDGRRVEVVDTPGLFDSTLSHEEVNEEMLKCISLLAPGPHIFLLVLQLGRFTPEEKETLNLIKKGFGKDAEKFTIVLFTHGDTLRKKNLTLEDYVKTKCVESCKKLISDCGGRCYALDNEEENEERQHSQVSDLIRKIDAVVSENDGKYYTSAMLHEAEAAIQKEVQMLLKQKEEQFRGEMLEMEKKHDEEMRKIKLRMEEQRKEIEKERLDRDKELQDLEENIKRERALRTQEQNKREKEAHQREEQDRDTRRKYECKLQELEVKIKMESKENFDKELQETRDKMEQEREDWEEQRKQWWDKRHKEDELRRQEEHDRLERLEKEYQDKMESYKIKKEEEDQNRREQEEKQRKELQQRHDKQIEELKRSYEEDARKKAEEFNDFKRKKDIDFAALIDKHLQEVTTLKEEIQQGQDEYKRFQKLASHKEETLRGDMDYLKKQHKGQMLDLVIVALKGQKENTNKIRALQKKHEENLSKCKEDIIKKYEAREKEGMVKMKTKQHQDMKDLLKDTSKEYLQQRKTELSSKQEEQLQQLSSDLKIKKNQELERKIRELEEKHEHELNTFTQTLLEEHEKEQNRRVEKLEQKQQQEMEDMLKKLQGKESAAEVEQLRAKHLQEINDIKNMMIPQAGWCSIL